MKAFEAVETARTLDSHFPIYARIDGRAFSTFTRGMHRPYDARLSQAMIDTTAVLVRETGARLGYTQSDEISLVWLIDDPESDREMMFGAKVQKLVSALASSATQAFTLRLLDDPDPEVQAWVRRGPRFDARVLQLPTKGDAIDMLRWRERDACRNAVSMAAQSVCSHTELQGVNRPGMLDLLAQRGVDFDAYPEGFRRGTMLTPQTVTRPLTESERAAIPNGAGLGEQQVQRRVVLPANWPLLDSLSLPERIALVFGTAPDEAAA